MQEYFTIEEVEGYLCYNEEQIFEMMEPGRPGPTLAPARLIQIPLDAKEIGGDGKQIKIGPGVFEIDVFPFNNPSGGTVRTMEWSKNGIAYVNMFTSYEPYEQPIHINMQLFPPTGQNRRDLASGRPEIVPGDKKITKSSEPTYDDSPPRELILWRDGWRSVRSFALSNGPIPVVKSEVLILRETLLAFMEAVGKEIPKSLEFSPEIFVEACLKSKMKREAIAVLLHRKEVSFGDIGRLLSSNRVDVSKSGWEKRGKKLVVDGERQRSGK